MTSLRLAMRIARLQDAREDLSAARESRTVIGLAAGAVMAQNQCSPEEAFRILREASNATEVRAHFDE
ncbi:ANTAR domain-containing protein [Arthrobacter sp. 92]|uniref:ANTAR domain-containing protein n=1 Tax=Arthrobacter sp. 92 TaxID=3418175 RepID=UPI003CFE3FA6